jgi:hypothetical protein
MINLICCCGKDVTTRNPLWFCSSFQLISENLEDDHERLQLYRSSAPFVIVFSEMFHQSETHYTDGLRSFIQSHSMDTGGSGTGTFGGKPTVPGA